MGKICWFLYKTIHWHVVAFFVLMPDPSLLISSISTGASTFACFSLVYNGTAPLHCIAALFERIPAGRAITPLPTAPASLKAGSGTGFWDMLVEEKVHCKGIRKEKWEKAGSNQSKGVVEKHERTSEERKRGRSWQKESSHFFTYFLEVFFFPTSAFLPFPSPFHPLLLLPWPSFPTNL